MNQEELFKLLNNLGTLSRFLKIEVIGGRISEEEDSVSKLILEQDSLGPEGYTKVIATKLNVCDCGHLGEVGGRCSSCYRTLCRECSRIVCSNCGKVYCWECLKESLFKKNRAYCRSCQWKVIRRKIGRKLLGFD